MVVTLRPVSNAPGIVPVNPEQDWKNPVGFMVVGNPSKISAGIPPEIEEHPLNV
jgi:hypothetical protein